MLNAAYLGVRQNMKPVRDFKKQLDNLDNEVNVIASYVYAEMAIQHAASKSKSLLATLNRTPTFWRTCFAALQSGAYIAVGRVFDQKSPYNIDALLNAMEHDLSLFSKKALAARKRADGFSNPSELRRYLSKAYVADKADVCRIRKAVDRRRAFYRRAIVPVRHRHLAHRQVTESASVKNLYGAGKVSELWRLSVFLHNLNLELWGLYHNGRKPDLKIRHRYSPKVLFDKPGNETGPHERIVKDVRLLMELIAANA